MFSGAVGRWVVGRLVGSGVVGSHSFGRWARLFGCPSVVGSLVVWFFVGCLFVGHSIVGALFCRWAMGGGAVGRWRVGRLVEWWGGGTVGLWGVGAVSRWVVGGSVGCCCIDGVGGSNDRWAGVSSVARSARRLAGWVNGGSVVRWGGGCRSVVRSFIRLVFRSLIDCSFLFLSCSFVGRSFAGRLFLGRLSDRSFVDRHSEEIVRQKEFKVEIRKSLLING